MSSTLSSSDIRLMEVAIQNDIPWADFNSSLPHITEHVWRRRVEMMAQIGTISPESFLALMTTRNSISPTSMRQDEARADAVDITTAAEKRLITITQTQRYEIGMKNATIRTLEERIETQHQRRTNVEQGIKTVLNTELNKFAGTVLTTEPFVGPSDVALVVAAITNKIVDRI